VQHSLPIPMAFKAMHAESRLIRACLTQGPMPFGGRGASKDDVNEIRPGLWLGSYHFESGKLSRLQKRGITHVVQVHVCLQ